MLKLMKYELLKRKTLLSAILIIFIFLETGAWLGLKLQGNWLTMFLITFMMLVVGGIAFTFIDTVINYYSDFKSKNGYMLFLTPNSGYKIFGAKILFMVIELILMLILIFFAIRIDYNLFIKSFPSFVWDASDVLKTALGTENLTFWTALPLILTGIFQYITNVIVALLAITIAKTLLSERNFNWLFALLFYFALYTVIQLINFAALSASGFISDVIGLATMRQKNLPNINKYMMVGGGMYLALGSLAFMISGRLLTKRTDL